MLRGVRFVGRYGLRERRVSEWYWYLISEWAHRQMHSICSLGCELIHAYLVRYHRTFMLVP